MADSTDPGSVSDSGWFSYGPDTVKDLSASQREIVRQRAEARGRLLAVVQVEVFEHGAQAQVSFPPGAVLGVESDAAAVGDVVERARVELGAWR